MPILKQILVFVLLWLANKLASIHKPVPFPWSITKGAKENNTHVISLPPKFTLFRDSKNSTSHPPKLLLHRNGSPWTTSCPNRKQLRGVPLAGPVAGCPEVPFPSPQVWLIWGLRAPDFPQGHTCIWVIGMAATLANTGRHAKINHFS